MLCRCLWGSLIALALEKCYFNFVTTFFYCRCIISGQLPLTRSVVNVFFFITIGKNILLTSNLIFFRVLTVLTSIHVTVLTVSIFSVERYVAICHTLLAYKHRVSSLSRALKAILMIWLVGFSCALPITLQFDLVYQPHTNRTVCILNNKVGLYLALLAFVIFFLIPTLIIGTMYALIGIRLGKSAKMIRSNNNLTVRSKQRAPKMLSN